MAGGIAVNAMGYFLFVRGGKPLFASSFKLPETVHIDRSLLMGSALFGVGWGLAGLCPGPVVSSLLLNPVDMIIFVLIMCAGLKAGDVLKQKFWPTFRVDDGFVTASGVAEPVNFAFEFQKIMHSGQRHLSAGGLCVERGPG